jgi:hypothetical protein
MPIDSPWAEIPLVCRQLLPVVGTMQGQINLAWFRERVIGACNAVQADGVPSLGGVLDWVMLNGVAVGPPSKA